MSKIPEFLSKEQLEFLLRKFRLDDIDRRLFSDVYDIDDPDLRSPSPEPVYDPKTGRRTNTRINRARTKQQKERQIIIEELNKIEPKYELQGDYKPPKFKQKLFIPQVNGETVQAYVGMILGPKGANQKHLESVSNCSIQLRGDNSVYNKKSKTQYKVFGQQKDEPLHVVVKATNMNDLQKGVMVIEAILKGNPTDGSSQNNLEYIQSLIAQSAEWCNVCGKQGHNADQCKDPKAGQLKLIQYLQNRECELCNSSEHTTSDCHKRKVDQDIDIEDQFAKFSQETGISINLKKKQKVESKYSLQDFQTLPDFMPQQIKEQIDQRQLEYQHALNNYSQVPQIEKFQLKELTTFSILDSRMQNPAANQLSLYTNNDSNNQISLYNDPSNPYQRNIVIQGSNQIGKQIDVVGNPLTLQQIADKMIVREQDLKPPGVE